MITLAHLKATSLDLDPKKDIWYSTEVVEDLSSVRVTARAIGSIRVATEIVVYQNNQ